MTIIRGFPPQFRLDPTEQQLILDYLCPKARDPLHFRPDVVPEVDLYDDEENWKKLFKESGESELYFFTRLKKKNNEKGMRVERSFGQSVWKTQSNAEIYLDPGDDDKGSIHIGHKQSFTYKVKTSAAADSREDNGWVMHEYRLHQNLIEWLGVSGNSTDYVICCVRKKEEASSDYGQWHISRS